MSCIEQGDFRFFPLEGNSIKKRRRNHFDSRSCETETQKKKKRNETKLRIKPGLRRWEEKKNRYGGRDDKGSARMHPIHWSNSIQRLFRCYFHLVEGRAKLGWKQLLDRDLGVFRGKRKKNAWLPGIRFSAVEPFRRCRANKEEEESKRKR